MNSCGNHACGCRDKALYDELYKSVGELLSEFGVGGKKIRRIRTAYLNIKEAKNERAVQEGR